MNQAVEEIMKNKEDFICEPRFIYEPHTDFKDIIYLENMSYDDSKTTEDYEDIKLKAEVLINYINKLQKAKLLVSYYEDTVNALMQKLPEGIAIEASDGVTYFVAKKPFDRYYYTTRFDKESNCCLSGNCMEKEND